jgi:hypothetical protein
VAAHGNDGRRWQADSTAKLVAWVNSRKNVDLIAFCIAFEYCWEAGRMWDYSMGHYPGEAALYTASALIDGFPYRRETVKDEAIQAAWFGETFMIWTERAAEWEIQLPAPGPWVAVDAIGRVRPLAPDPSLKVRIPIGSSPIYLLREERYQQLTRR